MIRYVTETGSTNADLIARLRAGEHLAEGDWLVTDRQTAGRGRQGREWFDGAGNFMGSTIVHLRDSDPAAASLALVVGVALYEAVFPFLPDPAPLRLKWPNDLTFAGAKAAGILLERERDALVIGIGVNLVQAPVIAGRETIALSRITPAPPRDEFASTLSASLVTELGRWRDYGLEPVLNRWSSVAHPKGTSLIINTPGEDAVAGTFDGLTDDGALRLTLADGSSRVIHAGDVFFARKEC